MRMPFVRFGTRSVGGAPSGPSPVYAAAAVAVCALAIVLAGCAGRDLDGTGLVRITDRVYALIADGPSAADGLGANAGFIVGDDGVLVVDTRYTPELARSFLETIRSVTGAPIRYVVNTHYHPDHVWGNSVFKDEGAVIISHATTPGDIEIYSPLYLEHYRTHRKEAFELLKDVVVTLPDSTFEDVLVLDLGGVTVEVRHAGPAHTAGDCVVYIPRDGVLFAGGIAANGYHLNLGDDKADYDNWTASLIRLGDMALKYVVPSQGMIAAPEILDTCREYIVTLRNQCRREISAGSYLDVAALTMKIPGTEGYLQENLVPFNVQAVYRREIMRVLKPGFTFDLPAGFVLDDGGVEGRGGRIKWAWSSQNGTLEVEVHWNPSVSKDLLPQDVTDRVARTVEANKGVLSMEIEGTKQLAIGGEEAPAAFGTFKVFSGTRPVGSGIWTWCMLTRGGNLYSIQLQTDARADRDRERKNMDLLEKIAGTFRLTTE